MRFMILGKATSATEAGGRPTPGTNLELTALAPSSAGARVGLRAGQPAAVTAGPFAGLDNVVASYAILEHDTIDDVVDRAMRALTDRETGELELRPIAELADFPDVPDDPPIPFATPDPAKQRFIVFVKAVPASETGAPPSREMLECMGAFNAKLSAANVMLAADGLTASKLGKRVRVQGGQPRVIDGPFAEAKELVAGFWIWQCKDLAEAIAWASQCPDPHEGGGTLEIRPIA